jgi:hypothetical protein
MAGLPGRVQAEMDKNGLTAVNKPKRTPDHPRKSHIVMASEKGKYKLIRFGEQGAKTSGPPKPTDTEAQKKRRAAFKARHQKNIDKGKMSAAFWADQVKWILVVAILIGTNYGEFVTFT